MPKRFRIEVLETGVQAVAELLEDDAPRTCAALWQMLETPIEQNGVHAMWSGREVMTYVPEENRGDIDPAAIGVENATVYPAPATCCGPSSPAAACGASRRMAGIWPSSMGRRRASTFPPAWRP